MCPEGAGALSFPTELWVLLPQAGEGTAGFPPSSAGDVPWSSSLCCHCCSSILRGQAALCIPPRGDTAPSGTTTSAAQWRLGESRGSVARLQHRVWKSSSAHLWVTSGDTAPLSSTAHIEEPWTRSCWSPAWPHLTQLLYLPLEHPVFTHNPGKKCPVSSLPERAVLFNNLFQAPLTEQRDCLLPLCSVRVL